MLQSREASYSPGKSIGKKREEMIRRLQTVFGVLGSVTFLKGLLEISDSSSPQPMMAGLIKTRKKKKKGHTDDWETMICFM